MTLHPRHDPDRRRRDAERYVAEPIRALRDATEADRGQLARDFADNVGEGIGLGTIGRDVALALLRSWAERTGFGYAELEARAFEVEAIVRRATGGDGGAS